MKRTAQVGVGVGVCLGLALLAVSGCSPKKFALDKLKEAQAKLEGLSSLANTAVAEGLMKGVPALKELQKSLVPGAGQEGSSGTSGPSGADESQTGK